MSVRVVVRTISELCITVGSVIVLFVVYVLFWTGVKADSAMDHQIDVLQKQWSKGAVTPKPASTGDPSASLPPPAPPVPRAPRPGP